MYYSIKKSRQITIKWRKQRRKRKCLYQPTVWSSALLIDCSSCSSPGKWNHRVSFSSNDFGIVMRLDFIETLKIRLKGPQMLLFDPVSTASPHLKTSPSSWIDLIAFLVILAEVIILVHLPGEKLTNREDPRKIRACDFTDYFQQACGRHMRSCNTKSRWRLQKKSWFGPQNSKSVYFIPWKATSQSVS